MSETPELPPLPPAEFWRYRFSDWPAGSWEGSSSRPSLKGDRETGEPRVQPMFSRDQVSAYGRECWEAGRRAGLEEAAKLCLERSRGAPEAMAAEAMLCAAHIRAKAELHQPCRLCIGTGQNLIHGGVCGACGGTGRAKP